MSLVTMELVQTLTNEICEWVQQNWFLLDATDCDILSFDHAGHNIKCMVRDVSEYIASIDINKTATPFLTLQEDILSEIETSYNTITSYGPLEPEEIVQEANKQISSYINENPRIQAFAQEAFENDSTCDDPNVLIAHVHTTIASHFATILHARILTLSKRYGPTEVLFKAYKAGLFPFGWDWEEEAILCVRPSSAQT